ncbi:MAG: hypothetical protein JWL95_1917 [Gemmatimonadetes bacterium]|nr:hypothetical protein [Gemmatimonadota bacterium]
MSADLWSSDSMSAWRSALDSYSDVVAKQGVARLPELDRWYREELAALLDAREPRHVELPELVRLTEWKMARGVWRAPNLVLVRSNPATEVIETSARALAQVPHPTKPIATLAKLKGVGPATASAVAAAAAPSVYPFFDELVAEQVPSLGKVAWTLGYYARYANALRERARALGTEWTPVMVERAVWAWVGGKAGTA